MKATALLPAAGEALARSESVVLKTEKRKKKRGEGHTATLDHAAKVNFLKVKLVKI